jgi:hypothetical protein
MIKKLLILTCMFFVTSCKDFSDAYTVDQTVQILGNGHSCSGSIVQLPSGNLATLTAGHCKVLLDSNGSALVTMEDGRASMRHIIAEDGSSDLLLLEAPPNVKGLHIAKVSHNRQKIHLYSHRLGMKTSESFGSLIQDMQIQVQTADINSPEDEKACTTTPKSKVVEQNTFFGSYKMCVLDVNETVSDAPVSPGSSGSAVLSLDNQVVGVTSASGEGMSFFVPLKDIQRFLANY